jgi:hypothetical protein
MPRPPDWQRRRRLGSKGASCLPPPCRPLFADTQFLHKLYDLRLCSGCYVTKRSFALAAMASIGMPLVVDWADINRRRWRDIDRRRWRVIDGRRRSDIHRLRCECVAHNSANTKSQDARSNCRTIAGMSRSSECDCGNSCRCYGKVSLMHVGDPLPMIRRLIVDPSLFPSC